MGKHPVKKRLLYYLIPLLSILTLLVTSAYALRLRTSNICTVLIPATSSIGFTMNQPEQWLNITVSSGDINSSQAEVYQDYREGYLSFLSNETVSFTTTFGGLRVNVNGLPIHSGDTSTVSASATGLIRWYPTIFDPFEYYTYPVIGVAGFILTAASGFYLANKLRNRDDDMIMGIAYSIVFLILGGGFIMVWLWG